MSGRQADMVDDHFFEDVRKELDRARSKFPAPNLNLAALTEEVGEVAQALLHLHEGKSKSWWDVYNEAVQVAVMAARLATEGDPSIAIPTKENCE